MKINTKFLFALLLMLGSFSSYAQIPPPGYYLKDVIQNFKDSMNSESGIKNIQSYYLSRIIFESATLYQWIRSYANFKRIAKDTDPLESRRR